MALNTYINSNELLIKEFLVSILSKNQKRLCRKAGWYEGKIGSCPEGQMPYSISPYEDHQSSVEFELGYFEGEDAKDTDQNPYGVYKDN